MYKNTNVNRQNNFMIKTLAWTYHRFSDSGFGGGKESQESLHTTLQLPFLEMGGALTYLMKRTCK